MYVKQIDQKTALELAARGKEVLVMVPAGKDSGWDDMMPSTLGHLLEGCMFFRREPAMEVELAGPAEIEPAQPDPSLAGKKRGPKKALDVGKLVALHKAGWPAAKIADELRVTERTVYAHLQKFREEGEDHEENTENAGTGTGT